MHRSSGWRGMRPWLATLLSSMVACAATVLLPAAARPWALGLVAGGALVACAALARIRALTGEIDRRTARTRAFSENRVSGIVLVDENGTILENSPATRDILGLEPDALIGTNSFARAHPDDRERIAATFAELRARPGTTREITARVRHADDGWRTLEHYGTNLLHEPGIEAIVINYRDITARVRAETSLAGQATILELIAQDVPLAESLAALARLLEAASDGALVSIQLLIPEGQYLRGIAAPSLPASFTAAMQQIPVCEGAGSCGTAAARDAAVIVADILTDPLWADYRALAQDHGLRACWSLPIRTPGSALLGTFAVYHTTSRGPDADEWQLLDRAVSLAALAIERDRAAALRDSERDYRLLLDQAADAIIIFDQGGNIVRVNDRACLLTGYSRGELLDRPFSTLIPLDEHDDVAHRIATLSGTPRTSERAIVCRDGRHIQVEVSAIRIDDGRAQVIARDITARREAEAALREAEARFRVLVEQIPAMAYIAGAKVGVTTYVSPQIEPLLGYSQAEWLADPQCWAAALHPDDRDRAVAFMSSVRATGEAGAIEYRLIASDGRTVWVRDEATLVRDEQGKPIALQGIVTDITARREAEAALREREERFRLVARATNDAIWDWDLTTDSLWWSTAIQQILGYAPEEIGPAIDWWEEHIHPAERGEIIFGIRAAIAGDAAHWSSEYRLRRADGGYALVLDRGFILRDEAGRARRMLGSVQDVTAQKRAEAEARRQARELALLDRVRTALARELELPAILEALVNTVAIAFDTVSVGVLLVEGECLIGRAHVDLANHPLSLHISEGVAGRCARTGAPILVPDVRSEPLFIGDPGQGGSEICVPLLAEGRVIGVLNVEREVDPQLDEADLALLTALGERASIAIGRARLHSALAASEARLRAIVDTALDAIITTSAADAIESFNQGAERIFGYSAAEAIGRPLATLLPSPLSGLSRTRLAQHLVRGLSNLGGRPLEMVGRRKDGSTFPAEVVLAQVAIEGERFFTGIVRDISERRAYEERLQHQAHHDPLTGLPNRALFLDRLNGALNRARRDNRQRAVLFLDLDRFKDVNDSWGHDAGDRLLVAVTARLRACLRDGDTLARQGGDEFTILLEDVADVAEAARVAERLAASLDSPFPIEGQEHRSTASIGIVMTQGNHLRAEDLLRDADIAMYRAKEEGKARYAIFDPAMQSGLLTRLELERELRQALQAERFALHYQPIVDLATRRVIKVEALARWQHPQRGFVPPTTFIPIAEESGLIRPLGRWVLREACRQARQWEEAGTPVAVAVNLTAHEFQQATLIDEVTGALAAADLAPELLLLEITESVAMRDVAATTATLTALRQHGVRVAIDDFGTGYSSLAYLKRLPVDTLKIDRAFIDGLGDDPEDTAIVEAIITLAHTLGLQVVAEGVETAAQAAQLRALGCEAAQGYLFARPLPAADLCALLRLDELVTDALAVAGND